MTEQDKAPPAASPTAEERAKLVMSPGLDAQVDEALRTRSEFAWVCSTYREMITFQIIAAESAARAERAAEVERLTDRVKLLEEDRAGHAAEVAQLRAQLAARSPARDRAAEADKIASRVTSFLCNRGWWIVPRDKSSHADRITWSTAGDEIAAALRALDAEAGGGEAPPVARMALWDALCGALNDGDQASKVLDYLDTYLAARGLPAGKGGGG